MVRGFRAVRLLILGLALGLAAPAVALDLGEAKAKGLVGEQADGYLGVVAGGGEASALARDVNAKRRAEYEGIAKKRGATVEAVAALAGKKLVERTPRGQYVRGSDGAWAKK
jgi:uncharacterized protein YdbL (DUF1318 family)